MFLGVYILSIARPDDEDFVEHLLQGSPGVHHFVAWHGVGDNVVCPLYAEHLDEVVHPVGIRMGTRRVLERFDHGIHGPQVCSGRGVVGHLDLVDAGGHLKVVVGVHSNFESKINYKSVGGTQMICEVDWPAEE